MADKNRKMDEHKEDCSENDVDLDDFKVEEHDASMLLNIPILHLSKHERKKLWKP